ncbi:MAG: hypothetical protein UZ05_CHB002001046 [Chlorobi bacterium OLB5]|nr:MAG: hypothetical protein UZ05_CHB002001046 [Chlorobi bacterium OLB5]
MGYFNKLSEYYKSEQFEKDGKRFEKQLKGSFISTAVIIGIVFLLIIVLVILAGIQSIFN